MKLSRLDAAVALTISLGIAGCGPVDDGPTSEITNLDGDAALSDHDSLYEGWPGNEKLPSEGKADDVYPKKYTELVALQSPVRNQAARGVCSIFSGVGIMEHLYVKEGTILEPDFSEEFLQWSSKVELGRFTTSEGSNSAANLETIHRYGIVTEADWPYLGRKWSTADDAACTGDDQPTRCYTHGDPPAEALAAERWHLPAGRWISSRRNSIKAHMTTHKTAVVVGGTFFYQSWNHRSSTLTTNNEYWRKGIVTAPNADDKEVSLEKRAGHSFVLVGWDDELEVQKRDKDGNLLEETEKGFYLFKNSWGTGSFGVENEHGPGYGWISMAYVENYLTAYVSGVPELDLEEVCGDSTDNDFDGDVDCDDSDCAAEAACGSGTVHTYLNDTEMVIPDNDAAGVSSDIVVDDGGAITALSVTVDISHTYRGDLKVKLVGNDGTEVTLHDRQGGGADDLSQTFVVTDFDGADAAGTWRLVVSDHAGQDVGTLSSWSLEIKTGGVSNVEKFSNDDDLLIPDNDPAGVSSLIDVASDGVVRSVKVVVSIDHSYKGDLSLSLSSAAGTTVELQAADASSGQFGTKSYTVVDFDGEVPTGDWTLSLSDHAAQDVGTLTSWSVELTH